MQTFQVYALCQKIPEIQPDLKLNTGVFVNSPPPLPTYRILMKSSEVQSTNYYYYKLQIKSSLPGLREEMTDSVRPWEPNIENSIGKVIRQSVNTNP